MAKVVLREIFREKWSESEAFTQVSKITGQTVREKEGRRTLRFEFEQGGYYLKHHRGVGWSEIIKNLLQLRLPIIGASNEWFAIERLHQLGIGTLEVVAFGVKGINPATQQSFIITKELVNIVGLDHYCTPWLTTPPSFALKLRLIEQVATITKQLHADGINHRDLYLCHFLLDMSLGLENIDRNNIRLYLVDLHRAQMRARVPQRWRVKDVGSLYFSALDIGLTPRDIFRFIKIYTGEPLRQALQQNPQFWHQVVVRAKKLYQRDFGRAPAMPVS